jgi:hypothetical protein
MSQVKSRKVLTKTVIEEVLIEHDVNSSSQEELRDYFDKVLNMD